MNDKNMRKFQRLSERIRELEAREAALKSQLSSTLVAAFENIAKCGKDKYMGSGVIISVKKLDSTDVVSPFTLRDGMSEDLIYALRNDICKSFELGTLAPSAMIEHNANNRRR